MTEAQKWVDRGENGVYMCEACRFSEDRPEATCDPCPMAWRMKDGKVQYWRKPIHDKEEKRIDWRPTGCNCGQEAEIAEGQSQENPE